MVSFSSFSAVQLVRSSTRRKCGWPSIKPVSSTATRMPFPAEARARECAGLGQARLRPGLRPWSGAPTHR